MSALAATLGPRAARHPALASGAVLAALLSASVMRGIPGSLRFSSGGSI